MLTSKQTPGQARSRPGKVRRKAEKKQRLQEEASARGVDPIDILQERAIEADQKGRLRAQQENRRTEEARRQAERYSRAW